MSRIVSCFLAFLLLFILNDCFCKKIHHYKKHHSHERHKHKHHSHERHKHKHWYTRPKSSFYPSFYPTSTFTSTTSYNFEPLNYLRRNNFNLAPQSKQPEVIQALSSLSKEKDETKNMIKLYQKLYNLRVTGELNEETLKKMESPSCANPDIELSSNRKKRSSDWLQSKWIKNILTYKIFNVDKTLKQYTK